MQEPLRIPVVAFVGALLVGCLLGAAAAVAWAATLGITGWSFVAPAVSSSLRCTCVRDVITVQTPSQARATLTLMAVQANTAWQDTGVRVSRGETVRIAYVCGRWCPWSGFCLDARGCVGVDPAVCSPNPDDAANLIAALHASLIARIAENPAFPVGHAVTFQAAHDGMLQLRINDRRVEDNSGAIVVLVATGACASDGR
ncbi:MAG: hypothetical protein NZ765_07095 [Anaerolineae bacterium]|nr:hypothetical protein [Anaerolineae bacterium]MDW8071305.1 hypothetical protein [Anaerolineae bacterium]